MKRDENLMFFHTKLEEAWSAHNRHATAQCFYQQHHSVCMYVILQKALCKLDQQRLLFQRKFSQEAGHQYVKTKEKNQYF